VTAGEGDGINVISFVVVMAGSCSTSAANLDLELDLLGLVGVVVVDGSCAISATLDLELDLLGLVGLIVAGAEYRT